MSDIANVEEGEARRLLAHDLLQSASIIQSILGSIRARGVEPERLAAELATVEAEVQVMAERCQRTVDGSTRSTLVDLGVLANRVGDRFRTLYTGQIDIQVEAGDLGLLGDPAQWEQGLLNLLENACRAAGPDGKVQVRCLRTPAEVRLQVDDTGPGFGEAPAGRSSLGMVAVTRLADAHGGHLELRRSPLGGAQLSIVVPWPDEAARPKAGHAG